VALSRPPTEEEQSTSLAAFVKFKGMGPNKETANQRALAAFCHALVNSAAFLYVD
jgi:hypothetical protein